MIEVFTIGLDRLIVFCTECGIIGHGNPEIGKSGIDSIKFTHKPLVMGTLPIWHQNARVFICPNCSIGRVVFFDRRLSIPILYNPWDVREILDEDKKIIREFLKQLGKNL